MHVLFVGQATAPVFYAPEHTHSCWEIVFVKEGTGRVESAVDRVEFEPGTVYLVPPDIPHFARSEQGFRDVYIHVDTLAFPANTIFPLRDMPDVAPLMELLGSLYLKGVPRNQLLLDSGVDLLLQMLQQRLDESGCNPLALAMRDYMAHHLSDAHLDMPTLITQFHYSDDHLRRSFRADFGMTPLEYLQQMRVEHAKRLLLRTPFWTIEQVSLQCGYEDPLYFSRVFKSMVGASPRKYRQSVHQSELVAKNRATE